MAYQFPRNNTKLTRNRLRRIGGGDCYYCSRPIAKNNPDKQLEFTVDHKTPLAKGGRDDLQNKVGCCITCNSVKSDLTAEEFLSFYKEGMSVFEWHHVVLKFRAERDRNRDIARANRKVRAVSFALNEDSKKMAAELAAMGWGEKACD